MRTEITIATDANDVEIWDDEGNCLDLGQSVNGDGRWEVTLVLEMLEKWGDKWIGAINIGGFGEFENIATKNQHGVQIRVGQFLEDPRFGHWKLQITPADFEKDPRPACSFCVDHGSCPDCGKSS
jgi:hypothetical protein